MRIIKVLLFICLISACKKTENCESYYNDYINSREKSNNEKSLLAIDKAIKCDKSNEDFRFEKLQFLISLKDYSAAKNELLELGKLNYSFIDEFPLYGVLEYKTGNSKKGTENFEKVFQKLSNVKYDESNFNLYYYKLLTQIYIEGKESTLKEITSQKKYTKTNDKAALDFLANLIKAESNNLSVLCKALGVDS